MISVIVLRYYGLGTYNFKLYGGHEIEVSASLHNTARHNFEDMCLSWREGVKKDKFRY